MYIHSGGDMYGGLCASAVHEGPSVGATNANCFRSKLRAVNYITRLVTPHIVHRAASLLVHLERTTINLILRSQPIFKYLG